MGHHLLSRQSQVLPHFQGKVTLQFPSLCTRLASAPAHATLQLRAPCFLSCGLNKATTVWRWNLSDAPAPPRCGTGSARRAKPLSRQSRVLPHFRGMVTKSVTGPAQSSVTAKSSAPPLPGNGYVTQHPPQTRVPRPDACKLSRRTSAIKVNNKQRTTCGILRHHDPLRG